MSSSRWELRVLEQLSVVSGECHARVGSEVGIALFQALIYRGGGMGSG